jgi:hypothetical protein
MPSAVNVTIPQSAGLASQAGRGDLRVSQNQLLASQAGRGDLRVSQADVLVLWNFPTVRASSSQADIASYGTFQSSNRVTQFGALALIRPRVINQKIRAWGFSQNGHDFYVLRLGTDETLVYDATTGQWSNWASPNLPYFIPLSGLNWLGYSQTNVKQGLVSDVIAGDDSVGTLWLLDPNLGYDQLAGPTDKDVFERIVTGGITLREFKGSRTNAVYLACQTGFPQDDIPSNITLNISDDGGNTWLSMGTQTLQTGVYNQNVIWRSLGAARNPGRIFQFVDTGATVRIDGAEVNQEGFDA